MDVGLTGVNGFLGAYLARSLVNAGHHVIGMVRATSQTEHVEADIHQKVVGDLTDATALRRLAEAADVIIHNACDPEVDRPLRHMRANVLGSLQLLELTRLSGASQFIFISSAEVYHNKLSDRLLDEDHPVAPGDLAAAHKVAVEAFLSAYYERYAMNTSAFRPASLYGIHHDWHKSRYYEVVNAVTLGDEVDTGESAHVVHVDDVTEAVVRAVGDYSVSGQVFNLVDCHAYAQEVAQMAKDLTDSPSIIYDRKSDRPEHHFIMTKTEETLGIDINRGHDGLRDYVSELLDRFRDEPD